MARAKSGAARRYRHPALARTYQLHVGSPSSWLTVGRAACGSRAGARDGPDSQSNVLRGVQHRKRSRGRRFATKPRVRRGCFYDLTVPVLRGKKVESLLCAGAFLRQPLTHDTLVGQWQMMTGSTPSDFDPLYRRFVRLALRLPVLDADDLRAFRELLEIMAQLLVGRGDPARHERRIAALRIGVFSRWLTSLEVSVKRFIDPVQNRAWNEGLLFSHEKQELGMDHMPNIVVAITSQRGRHDPHPVAELANGRELQRSAVRFVRTLPETLAAPLDDYGVVFLSHVAEGRTKAARRAHRRSRRKDGGFRTPRIQRAGRCRGGAPGRTRK